MLKINVPILENKKNPIHTILLAAALFIGIMGAFFSMLEISTLPPTLRITNLLSSFKVLLNHLFTISEQHQAYLYERFLVPVSPEYYLIYVFFALIFIAITAALYIFIMLKLKSKIMGFFLFFLLTSLQIYFGVFATPIWNIILYTAIALALLQKARIVAFATASAVVVVIVLFIFPGPNANIAILSENIRDQFGQILERPIAATTPLTHLAHTTPQTQEVEMREEEAGIGDTPEGGHEYSIDRDERFAGSQIGAAIGQRLWVLWLIGLAFLVGYIIWLANKIFAAYKKQAAFNSTDNATAIDSMFKHLTEWLIEFGINPQNHAYAEYVNQLGPILPTEYAESYPQIVELWQETIYSNHTMTEEDKNQMRLYLNEIKTTLTKPLNPLARAKVKAKLFLRTNREVQDAEA